MSFLYLQIDQKTNKIFVRIFAQASKGQLVSKANCQALISSKKRMNEFIFTTMLLRVLVCFLEEIEVTKETFQNYLTFSTYVGLNLNQTLWICQGWSFCPFFGKNVRRLERHACVKHQETRTQYTIVHL